MSLPLNITYQQAEAAIYFSGIVLMGYMVLYISTGYDGDTPSELVKQFLVDLKNKF